MANTTKGKMVSFAALLVAAILGAAMWEGISQLTKPAIAQEQNYPDPRNVTAMRMEQLKATAEINQNIIKMMKFLESGELKVQAEVTNLDENSVQTGGKSKKKKSSSSRKINNGNTEIEIIKD